MAIHDNAHMAGDSRSFKRAVERNGMHVLAKAAVEINRHAAPRDLGEVRAVIAQRHRVARDAAHGQILAAPQRNL